MPIDVIPGRGSKPADWESIVAVATFCTDRDYGFSDKIETARAVSRGSSAMPLAVGGRSLGENRG